MYSMCQMSTNLQHFFPSELEIGCQGMYAGRCWLGNFSASMVAPDGRSDGLSPIQILSASGFPNLSSFPSPLPPKKRGYTKRAEGIAQRKNEGPSKKGNKLLEKFWGQTASTKGTFSPFLRTACEKKNRFLLVKCLLRHLGKCFCQQTFW